MFKNKRIMCTLCLQYAPDCNLGNKQEILNLISAVTVTEFQCDFAVHVCAKCLISLKAAYRIQQKFVRAIELFISLPKRKKVEYVQVTSDLSEAIDLSPSEECLICQRVVSAENMEQHLKRHFETKLTCDICNITVSNIGDYRRHCKSAKHAEINYCCSECDVTFLYKSLYNVHIKEHQNSREINEPEQINFELGFIPENDSVQEQPIIKSEKRDNGLSNIREALIKKSKNIGNKKSKMKTKKTYELRKYKVHKDNDKKELIKIEPEEEEELKYMCVECSAKFGKIASYILHLEEHFNKGDIDIYLLELLKNEIYGPNYNPGNTKTNMNGPQTNSPKYPDSKVIEIILKEDPKIVAKPKVVKNANENDETKEKWREFFRKISRRRGRRGQKRLGRNMKQSKYVRLVTKIKRIYKGEETIYDKVEMVTRADLEKIKEEREKLQAELPQPTEEASKAISDLESKGNVVCEMCSTPVGVKNHECPEKKTICEHCGLDVPAKLFPVHSCNILVNWSEDDLWESDVDITPKDKSKRTIWDMMNEEPPEEAPSKIKKAKCQDCSVIKNMNLHRCPNRMVLCEYCGMALTEKNCRHHFLRWHPTENNFKCNICGQLCGHRFQLLRHKRICHGPKKKFICSFCGRNFSVLTTMRVHERQHTNETPYKCDICGEAFKQNVLLRRHRSSIHKIFETMVCACDKCGKDFSSRVALIAHISRVHSGAQNLGQS